MSIPPRSSDRDWRRVAQARTILGLLFALLTALAVLVPTWIESATGASPDGGNGSAELLLAVLAGVATLVTAVSAGLAWRRAADSRS